MMINISRARIIAIVVTIIVILLTWYCIVLVSRIGKIAIDVETSPQDTTIQIDDKSAHTGINYIAAGTHVFRAAKEGYDTAEQTVTVDETNNYVALLPEPITSDAINEANSSEESSRAETISGIASSRSGEAIQLKNPIVTKLPYSDISGPFKIDYGYNQDNKDRLYLIVSYASPKGRVNAINWLRQNKVDVTLTEVVFQDFNNPTVKDVVHE